MMVFSLKKGLIAESAQGRKKKKSTEILSNLSQLDSKLSLGGALPQRTVPSFWTFGMFGLLLSRFSNACNSIFWSGSYFIQVKILKYSQKLKILLIMQFKVT